MVSCVPEVQCMVLDDSDAFVLLACDGVFDVMSSQEAVSFCAAQMAEHGDVQRAAAALVFEAIQTRGTRDNVTVVLIDVRSS